MSPFEVLGALAATSGQERVRKKCLRGLQGFTVYHA